MAIEDHLKFFYKLKFNRNGVGPEKSTLVLCSCILTIGLTVEGPPLGP